MARFDRNAPYETVGGVPGAAFSQNGRMFNNGGYEVEVYYVGEGDDRRPLARRKPDATPALTGDEEDELRHSVDEPDDPKTMHWRKLKALVEQYGGRWTNRDAALAFLSGREPADEDFAA